MSAINVAEPIDPFILGQNQFFGVNHLSDRKAAERERQFADLGFLIRFLEDAADAGVTGLTLTTHPRTPEIIAGIRKSPKLRDMAIYPGIPDPGKLMRMFGALGPIGTLKTLLQSGGLWGMTKLATTGLTGLARGDILSLMRTLIDLEMAPFSGCNVRAVFLTNNLNDLALGLDLKDVFNVYFDHVLKKHRTIPAFMSTNLPTHVAKMKEYGLPSLPVMTAINRMGLYVHPGVDEFIATARAERPRIVAMTVLACGGLTPKDAFQFLATVPSVESVTVGASTPQHVRDVLSAMKEAGRAG
jgi:hypothetical protein